MEKLNFLDRNACVFQKIIRITIIINEQSQLQEGDLTKKPMQHFK